MSVGFIDAPPDLRPDAKKNTTEVYPNGETLHRGGYPWLQRLRDDTVAGGESSLTATADMPHPPTLLDLAKTGDQDAFPASRRAQSPGVASPLLSYAGLAPRRRGPRPGDVPARLARTPPVRRTRLLPRLALSDRH